MSFADRMLPALTFESEIIDRLNRTGWRAWPFGQGQLPDDCRKQLGKFEDLSRRPTLLRWMPDILAIGDVVALIDAKTSRGNTPNYSLELSAIETANVYADQLYTPTFFVFEGWQVLTPRDARQRGRVGPDPAPGRGSGTPYVLVDKRWARPFDEFFPPVQVTT